MFAPAEVKRLRKIIDAATGPSPWDLRANGPKFMTKYGITHWEDAGKKEPKVGKVILKAGDENLAIFDFHHYVIHLKDSLFLVWNQKTSKQGPSKPVNFLVFDCNLLEPIENIEKACKEMVEQKMGIYHIGGLVSQVDLPTTNIDSFEMKFPEYFDNIDELLVLIHSSALGDFSWEQDNLCIVSITPRNGICVFYPQDWFNTGKYDYGYQWVPKVARDPKTRKIIGQGIRIRDFVLDDTNRKIERYL